MSFLHLIYNIGGEEFASGGDCREVRVSKIEVRVAISDFGNWKNRSKKACFVFKDHDFVSKKEKIASNFSQSDSATYGSGKKKLVKKFGREGEKVVLLQSQTTGERD